METRRLEYFVVLTAERSFSRAAERLHITQSALSQQIQRLEKDVGGKLIDRAAPRFTLTVMGTRLLEHSRELLKGVERIASLVTDANSGVVGRLRMGLVPSLLYSHIPATIRKFSAAGGDLEITVSRAETRELIEQLKLSQIDVVFLYTSLRATGLAFTELYREPFVAVLPTGHPLAERPEVSLIELRDETLILSQRFSAPEAHDKILAACVELGFAAQSAVVAGSTYTDQIGLAAAGLGIALIPQSVANLGVTGTLCLPLVPRIESSVLMAWNPSIPDPARDRFLRYAQAEHRMTPAGSSPEG